MRGGLPVQGPKLSRTAGVAQLALCLLQLLSCSSSSESITQLRIVTCEQARRLSRAKQSNRTALSMMLCKNTDVSCVCCMHRCTACMADILPGMGYEPGLDKAAPTCMPLQSRMLSCAIPLRAVQQHTCVANQVTGRTAALDKRQTDGCWGRFCMAHSSWIQAPTLAKEVRHRQGQVWAS